MATKAVLLVLIAGALACRVLLPVSTPRAGVRLRLTTAGPKSHPLADLTELDEWFQDYEAYQVLDQTLDEVLDQTLDRVDEALDEALVQTRPPPVATVSRPLHADDEYPRVT